MAATGSSGAVATQHATGVFLTQKGLGIVDEKTLRQEAAKAVVSQGNQTSQSTLLLQKKKEMMEIQAMLDKKRDEFNNRMQQCQQKEIELAARQQQIRDQVSKFDKFLKDNDAKRSRANKRAADEIKLREQKESEIIQCHQQLEGMKVQKEVSKGQLERIKRYEKYLMDVAETSEENHEINDILMRYDTLTAANADLRESVRKALEEGEMYRIKMQNFIKEAQNEILVYNSEVAIKQQVLEQRAMETVKLEQTMQERENVSKMKARTLGEIKMAISNLYARARVRHYNENASLSEKLKMIEQRMIDYQDIVNMAVREKRLDFTRAKTA
eukprot:TRINITY_DN7380_c0_g1_i1.p1 TRINITY_DN7380_c0_g1~~TRINITY_DN7380_c0_g1_i1.p1  ORF type:complete len:328 (+),score=100.08 TRINITY_DN7380_c0_g1_i1:57-1040(+)